METWLRRLALCFFLANVLPVAAHTNVVIIYADDLGYGEVGCFGNGAFKTPRLDQMAREGARLTSFYSPIPYCAPSRGALMTGRYPIRNGLTMNPVPAEDPLEKKLDALGLNRSEITLGEAFQAHGYATAIFGKWHLGHRPELLPTRNGFDEYFGIPYSNDMHPVRLLEGEKSAEYPVYQATLTRRLTDHALSFMERHKSAPFFLYLAHHMPHKPLSASEAFYKKTGKGLYADVIAELDASVGEVLDAISRLGLEKNTLVVFTSDNGPWYGGSTGGLRGMKGQTFEGGLRVPFIARWPGVIPPGGEVSQPAIVMDLYTTALAAAGFQPPSDRVVDGRNLLPFLKGAGGVIHDALYFYQGNRIAAVRKGKWKLHLIVPGGKEKRWRPEEKWVDPRGPDGVTLIAPYEQAHPSAFPGVQTGDAARDGSLFDLESDPAEQHDVAAAHPDVVKALRADANAFVESLGKPGVQ